MTRTRMIEKDQDPATLITQIMSRHTRFRLSIGQAQETVVQPI